MKQISETIDGSMKDILQLKTLDNSLEYSQMYDALEDTPRDFQTKLIDALNSLAQTMGVSPCETFNKVLCKSDGENEDVKKKLYNWWRAFFEVLGKAVGNAPADKSVEFNQKIDDLMAEIMKAGDAEATDEDESVMESDDGDLGYQQATKDDEDKMLADMDFAIQHIGEIANKVKAIVNFINPYCETTFNEENITMKKPGRYGIGDHVLYKGEECVVIDVDEDLMNDEEIYQVSRDSDKVDGLSFNDWVTWDEIEPLEGFTEEENKTMKFNKIDERAGGDSDEWVSMDDFVGEEFGESSKGKMSINLTSAEESDLESCIADYIIQAEEKHGSESDMVIMTAASKALRWIEMICAKDCWRFNPEDVIINWADDSGVDDEFAPAKGNSKSVYDLVAEMYEEVSDYTMGSGTRGKPESDEEFMEDGGQKLKNELKKGDDGWTTIGQPVSEAKVVVDANDVWDVLDLLDNEIAHTELTDLINSHLRTEAEIMDAINELCGETITKKELNTLLSGKMATLVDYLGLDVEQYENKGSFVDSGKPTSVELEGSSEELKSAEVKDGEKQVTQNGDTKTLVTGSDDNNNKQKVNEMTIEQEIDDPWKLSELLWGQGKENLRDLLESELVDEEFLMQCLEDMEIHNLTNINDAFAFDFPTILDMLGLDGKAWSQNLEIKRKGEYDSDED